MEVTGYELYTVPPRWVFLKLETNEGVCGWGEPVVEGRGDTLCSAVSELIEDYVLGMDPTETGNCWSRMYRGDHYRGGPILMSAIAGIDQALWDIKGRVLDRPVYNLLGGPVRERVRVYQWLSGERPEDLAAAARQAVEEGYTALGLMAFVRPARVRTSEIVEYRRATSTVHHQQNAARFDRRSIVAFVSHHTPDRVTALDQVWRQL